jgi:RHH-type transcriptional regulator, rel operon repressor / antitoxin RelB
MFMTGESPTISLRLPKSSLRSLDKAAKATRRSRSYLMREALDHYLADIVEKESAPAVKPLSRLLAMAGIAEKLGQKPRTKKEIDAHIRWLRSDD